MNLDKLDFLASPLWVNALILIPIIFFFVWRKGLKISTNLLVQTGIFAAAFGFTEAAVVVYLRKIIELSSKTNLNKIIDQAQLANHLPETILTIEMYREAATIIMLATIAFIAIRTWNERIAIFLWTFALWDIIYYVGLYSTVKWPASLQDSDVLFLIPVPWTAQVWFPVAISLLIILAVIKRRH
jgi:hypothetical protein